MHHRIAQLRIVRTEDALVDLDRLPVAPLRLGEVLHAVVVAADRHDPLIVIEVARAEKAAGHGRLQALDRSEEHTSELQSLMRISYAVFCLKKKKEKNRKKRRSTINSNTNHTKKNTTS